MNSAVSCMVPISRGSYKDISEKGKRLTAETFKRFVLAFSVTSIILCVIVLQISMQKLFLKRGRVITKGESFIACVDCKKLQKSEDTFEYDPLLSALEPVTDGEVTKCCASNEPQLSALFEMSMRRREIRTDKLPTFNVDDYFGSSDPLPAFNASDFTLSPASAHKRLYPPENPAQKIDYTVRVPIFVPGNVGLLFQYDGSSPDPLVEHTHGVEVLKDGLRITQRGLYYVYSSINFLPESGHPCKKFAYKTWKHVVSVRHKDEDRMLLSSVHTCCDDCKKDETTRFTGGVFRLDVNDTIRLAISGHGLAYFQPEASFAGVAMLGIPLPSREDD